MNPDVILKNLTEDFGWINNPVKDIIQIINQDPSNMSFAWGVIQNIYNALLPIGYSLITVFFIMEVIKEHSNFHTISMEKTLSIFMKIIIAKLVMDNSFELMLNIFKISNGILINMQVSPSIPAMDLASMKATIESMDFFERMFYAMRMGFFGFIMNLCKIIINVIIYGRLVELFILTAFSPIPLSGIASGELSQSSKRYLQEFAAVCLQGVVILGTVMIYSGIVYEFFIKDWGIANMLASAILLVMMIFKSGTLARKLTGA